MDNEIIKRQRIRLEFLKMVYQVGNCNLLKPVGMSSFCETLCLDLIEALSIAGYLTNKGLLKNAGGDGYWTITSKGIDVIEGTNPELGESTFGVIVNNFDNSQFTNSPVQVGNVHSQQVVREAGD